MTMEILFSKIKTRGRVNVNLRTAIAQNKNFVQLQKGEISIMAYTKNQVKSATLATRAKNLPTPLSDFFRYIANVKGASPKTSDEYFYDLRTFYRFLCIQFELCEPDTQIDLIPIERVNLETLQKVDINIIYEYIAHLNHDRSNTAVSRARKIASIRSFFKFVCNRLKLLDENPAADIETPKIEKSLPKHLTIDDSLDLLSAIKQDNPKSPNANKTRDYCIITLFLNCGLRLAELISINISDIRGDTLTVLGKGGKERVVYLNDACLHAIGAHLDVRLKISNVEAAHKNALFLSNRNLRISRRNVQNMVEKYIKKTGLDPRRYTTHKLRHTAATLMYQNGVDIRALQEILGHEHLSTTEIYTHVDNAQLRDAVAKNPLASMNTHENTNDDLP